MLTLAQIQAAQRNDLDGIKAVLEAMQSRIDGLALAAARSMDSTARYADYREDCQQDALVALFEFLARFDGNSAEEFFAGAWANVQGELKAKAHAQRNPGVDAWATMVFKSMLERADGDLFLAERLAQTVPPAGRRLSADRANAARIAWQGSLSLDSTYKPDGQGDYEPLTFGNDPMSRHDMQGHADDQNEEIRPKVGLGAVREAAYVLYRYATVPTHKGHAVSLSEALDDLMWSGFARTVDVETIEDTVKVPKDAAARRYVLDAMAILRSAVSTTTEGELIPELRDVSDERQDERAARIGTVRAVLDAMGDAQRVVLAHSFGIGDAQHFGHGDSGDDEGLARAIGSTVGKVRDQRNKGLKAFAKRWIKAVARDAAEALSLSDAAAARLSRGGRK